MKKYRLVVSCVTYCLYAKDEASARIEVLPLLEHLKSSGEFFSRHKHMNLTAVLQEKSQGGAKRDVESYAIHTS